MPRLSPSVPRLAAVLALAALTTACGHNMEQRAATGAIAGAVVAGPFGAVVGAGAGAVVDKTSKPSPRSKKRR